MTIQIANPTLSIVLATHNRRDVVRRTFEQLETCGLDRSEYEVIVVDNASTDGTAEVAESWADRVIRLDENAGSCAKADGVAVARGVFVLFLDDDSYPLDGSLRQMLGHFADESTLGAAGFTVHLPSGALEGAALVDVFLGCGVGFRTAALRQVGGLDRSFFMQAEEYDLAFALTRAGWRVRMFDALHVFHEKTRQSRINERTMYYDIRNNLRVIARHLPAPLHRIYRADLLSRYKWLASINGHERAYARGVRDGRMLAASERRDYRARRLSLDELDHFFGWRRINSLTVDLARRGVGRVVFADLGKNIFAFYDACRRAGIDVSAIGDDRFAAPQRVYRGVPIVPLAEALEMPSDAVIVANSAAVFADLTAERVASLCQNRDSNGLRVTKSGQTAVRNFRRHRQRPINARRMPVIATHRCRALLDFERPHRLKANGSTCQRHRNHQREKQR